MYEKKLTCAIKGDIHHTLNFTINPTGTLSVKTTNKQLQANFNNLFFYKHDKLTEVICIQDGKTKHFCWELLLYRNDAEKLNDEINEAIDEYEIMMRDL